MQVKVENEELFCLRHGRGMPMMVMHGGPGLGHAYFRPFLDALAGAVEIVYYDQRGNGRSSGRDSLEDMTLTRMADDAEALRVALKLGPMLLLGHGFGGMIAQVYAQRYPQHLLGLVLCNTAPALDYPATMLQGARAYGSDAALSAVLACMTQPAADDDALRKNWQQALPSYFYRYQPMYGTAMGEGMLFSAPAYNCGMFALAPGFSSLPWLHTLQVPTLIAAGAHDWWAPQKEATERLAQHIAGSQIALFEHSGHYPFVEEPIGFCHAIRQLIKRVSPAT